MSEPQRVEQPDPLIDEIRQIRADLHAKFPNDLKAYGEYINKRALEVQAEMAALRAKQSTAEEKSQP